MPLYCSFKLIRKRGTCTNMGIYRMNQSQPNITSHIQSYCDGGIASSHVTFRLFILNYPPPNSRLALGGLLKLNGLRGGERDADSRCIITLLVSLLCFFRKTSDLYTF